MSQLNLLNNIQRNFFDPLFDYQPLRFNLNSSTDQDYSIRAFIKETDDEVSIDLEVPGYQKDQLSIEYHNQVLTVSSSIKEDEENPLELRPFTKTLRVSDKVDPDQLKATLKNGILNISIPLKVKIEKPKQISIK